MTSTPTPTTGIRPTLATSLVAKATAAIQAEAMDHAADGFEKGALDHYTADQVARILHGAATSIREQAGIAPGSIARHFVVASSRSAVEMWRRRNPGAGEPTPLVGASAFNGLMLRKGDRVTVLSRSASGTSLIDLALVVSKAGLRWDDVVTTDLS